jgi:Mg-chelatase subunit ChlD
MIHRGFLFMRIFLFLLLAVHVCQGQLRFEERVHDFGLIQGDDKRYTDFVAVNDGKKPVNILRVDNFRDREVQSLISKVYLLPGEKAFVRVQINPINEGRFSKDLAVYTSYNSKTIKLTVKGNTKNLADLQRQSCPDFNDHRNSTQKAAFKSVVLVEDAITGKPIKKAKVELIQGNYGLESKEFTSSNGECTVQLNPGLVQSRISAEGYETLNGPLVVKRSDTFHRIKLMPMGRSSSESENTFAQNPPNNQDANESNPYDKQDRTVGIYYDVGENDITESEEGTEKPTDGSESNPYDSEEKTLTQLPKESETNELAEDMLKSNTEASEFETNPKNPYDLEEKSVVALPDELEDIPSKKGDNQNVNDPIVAETSTQGKFDSNVVTAESANGTEESEEFNPYDDDVKTVVEIVSFKDSVVPESASEAASNGKFDTNVSYDDIGVKKKEDSSSGTNEVIEENTVSTEVSKDPDVTENENLADSKFETEVVEEEIEDSKPIVETEGFEESKFKANNVVFLIDKSISMRNDQKLDITKKAVIYLINRFRSIDNLGVVVYDTDAEVLIPSAPGDVVKSKIKNIEKLEASGKTFGAKGLREAYEMDLANFKTSGVNQIFIVTDGGFSEDISKVERVAKRCAAKNIKLHIIGVKNQKWTVKTFEAMAEISGGSYLHLSDIAEAESLLFNFIKENSSTE